MVESFECEEEYFELKANLMGCRRDYRTGVIIRPSVSEEMSSRVLNHFEITELLYIYIYLYLYLYLLYTKALMSRKNTFLILSEGVFGVSTMQTSVFSFFF